MVKRELERKGEMMVVINYKEANTLEKMMRLTSHFF